MVETYPELLSVDTSNAEVNTWMNAVNEALGYRLERLDTAAQPSHATPAYRRALPHEVERALHGGDLQEDVDAVLIAFDHPLESLHLPFDAAQPRAR